MPTEKNPKIKPDTYIRQREDLLHSLIEIQALAHVGIWEMNPGTGKIWGSDQAFGIYGMVPPEDHAVPAEMIRACIPERERVHRALVDLLERDIPFNIEFAVNPADGAPQRIITSSAHLLRDTSGRIRKVIGVIQDITGHKQVEMALRQSEERYRNVVEDQTEFISRFLPDGTHIFVNEAYCRYFGMKRDEILGHRFRPELPAEDNERLRQFFASLKRDRPLGSIRHRIIMPDRSVRWQRWIDRAIFDAEGKITEYQSVGRDITDVIYAEEALKESEKQYSQFFRTSLDCVFISSLDGHWIDCNDAAVELFGYSDRAELMQTRISDLYLNSEDRSRFIRNVAQQGYLKEFPMDFCRKDSSVRSCLMTAVALYDAQGTVKGFQGTIRDITDQKKAETAIRQANAYNRSLIEASLDPLVTIGPDGKITDVNASTESVTGFPRDRLVGTDFSDYFTEPQKAREGYWRVFSEGEVRDYPLWIRHRDGHVTPVLYNATVYRNEADEVIGIFAAARDITEIRRAEKERSMLAAIVTNSVDAIIGKSLDGTITSWNAGAAQMFGYSAGETIGRNILMLIPREYHADLENILGRIRRGETVFQHETVRMHKDGSRINVSLTVSPIRDHDGHLVGAATISQDITERKKAEAVLENFNRELEEQVRVQTEKINASLNEKDLLLREIHHRVKNNLQLIISLTNLQMRELDDGRLVSVMKETQNRVRAMSLVHEKLYQSGDIARIDLAGYTRFLGTQIFGFYGVRFSRVKLTVGIDRIMLDINTAIPIGLIINELVSNALKYAFPGTRSGELLITAREEGDTLHLTVQDDGVGMPPGFDMNTGQTLGMRLVWILVEQLKGSIELRPAERGTIFDMRMKKAKELNGTGISAGIP